MKKFINPLIIVICTGLIITLSVFTYQAVIANGSWAWFIDFKDANQTINSYGSISTAIISLLSTILLVYTIQTQLFQFKKQTQQFELQFGLQKTQFDSEKRKQEFDERKEMYFQLKFVDVYVNSFIKHIEVMGREIITYINYEKSNPLLHVNLSFNINKDAETLNKLDVISLFKTFQLFFENDNENWVKKFNELFGIITFYNDLLNELLINNKKHVTEKYDQKVNMTFEINSAMQLAQTISINYRKISFDYKDLPFYVDLENLVSDYNSYLKTNINKEGDFDYISKNILLPFIQNVSPILQDPNMDEYGLFELLNLVSNIRKKINFIKVTANTYVENMEKRSNEYFKEGNAHLKKLKEIQELINNKLLNTSIEDLR